MMIRRMDRERNLDLRAGNPQRAVFPRQMLRGAPMGTVMSLWMLLERLPVLVGPRLLWSQVLVMENNLDQLMEVPTSEHHLLDWADDLLVLIMLATLD